MTKWPLGDTWAQDREREGPCRQTGEAGQCWHCRIQPGEQPFRLELNCEVRSAEGRDGTSIWVQEEESCADLGLWHRQASDSKIWASAVLRGPRPASPRQMLQPQQLRRAGLPNGRALALPQTVPLLWLCVPSWGAGEGKRPSRSCAQG